MARWWRKIALCLVWLGVSLPAGAQFFPVNENPPGDGHVIQAADNTGATSNESAKPGAPLDCPPGIADGSEVFPSLGMPPEPLLPAPPAGPAQGPGGPGPDNAFNEHCPPKRPTPCFHANFEYLHLWLQKAPVPILVTTGSLGDTVPGALGEPNTRLVLDEVSGGSFTRAAGRLSLAVDLDELKTIT